MDLSWIWIAVAAVAAVLSSVWSIAQTIQSRSPFARYEQWVRIRDDHSPGSRARTYAEARVKESLIDLGSRGQISRVRRSQWVFIVLVVIVVLPLAFVVGRDSAQWLGYTVAMPIALVMILSDWRVGRARAKVRDVIFGSDDDGLDGPGLNASRQPG